MYKWMYNRLKAEYEKHTKEELIQEIMSLEEIECSNRAFANNCEAGATILNINNLFEVVEKLDVPEITETFQSAFDSWNSIKRGLHEINNNSRVSNNLADFRTRVKKAINDNDSI